MLKRAKLTGVDRLFENAPVVSAIEPQDTAKASVSAAPKAGVGTTDITAERYYYADDAWARTLEFVPDRRIGMLKKGAGYRFSASMHLAWMQLAVKG